MERATVEAISGQYDALLNEMGNQNFEVIRFTSYRTACKLKFIQKKSSFHLVDIWNAIEAIRENGLHVHQDVYTEISLSKLETLVTSIYYQLNKRLPASQHLNLDESIACLLTFLSSTFDPNGLGKVRVFATKLALATLASGKTIDKLKYMYSLISDPCNGHLIVNRFNAFLRELLALASSVFETGSYQYEESLSGTIFDFNHPVEATDFFDMFLNPNGAPMCLSWLIVFQRMTEVEHVVHPIQCDACNRQHFTGFRYKCQKCFNFQMCQDCFWRGRTAGSHNVDSHSCKEYCYWKSQSKEIGHLLRKSFRCIPSQKPRVYFKEEPTRERRFNLAHIVPPSPVPGVHHAYQVNGYASPTNYTNVVTLSGGTPFARSPPFSSASLQNSLPLNLDEEHRLIASYALKLAEYEASHPEHLEHRREELEMDSDSNVPSSESLLSSFGQQQQVISQLETKNREIMREITRIRENRDQPASPGVNPQDPMLSSELSSLRERKEELERHLSALQESRRELLVQLEGLMKLLKNHGSLLSASASASAVSTLNRPTGGGGTYPNTTYSTLSSTGSANSDISSIASGVSVGNHVNRDLLVAADSVTNAMSSLVKELNSDDEAVLDEMGFDLTKQLKLTKAEMRDGDKITKDKKQREKDRDRSLEMEASDTEEDEKLAFKLLGGELVKRKSTGAGTGTSKSTTTTTNDYITSDDDETDYIKTDEDDLDELEDEDWFNGTSNRFNSKDRASDHWASTASSSGLR